MAAFTGTIVRWFEDKGYGFIRTPGREADVFLHRREWRKSGAVGELKVNDKIAFDVEDNGRNGRAVNISRL